MSTVISTGTSDTTISGASAPTLTLPIINYGADFRVKTESSSEVVVVNTTSPLDQPESIRFGYSEIADIYAKSGLNSDLVSGTKKGINLLVQVNDTIKVSDPTAPTFVQYLPISAHVVIKVPQSSVITPAVVQTLINRLCGSLYENATTNLPSLLKGVLKPKAL